VNENLVDQDSPNEMSCFCCVILFIPKHTKKTTISMPILIDFFQFVVRLNNKNGKILLFIDFRHIERNWEIKQTS
jgi:hypothetical protein